MTKEIPYVDSQNIVAFLKNLKEQTCYSKIYLICDNAGYHKSNEIKNLTRDEIENDLPPTVFP